MNKRTKCPDCGSSDGLMTKEDHTYCWSCKKHSWLNKKTNKKEAKSVTNADLLPVAYPEELPKRKITQATCAHMGYHVAYNIQVANFYDSKGEIVAQKTRGKDKKFLVRGKLPNQFWRQDKWSGGKTLVITEGEIDALTMSQVQGNKWPVVSLPNGATSARKIFKANLEWLEGFERVVVCFDNDAAGREALEDIKGLLSYGKLCIMKLPLKDPNDMLKAGRTAELISAFWNAEKYTPEGIVSTDDLWEKMLHKPVVECFDYPWQGLTDMTHGLRTGEIVMVMAESGVGKSTMLREIAHHRIKDGHKCGLIFLEESAEKTAQGIMSVEANKPLHLLDIPMKDQKKYYDAVITEDRVTIYNHFGSLECDALLDRIRYMSIANDCRWIFLDHISILISGLDIENERKAIDLVMTKLRSLAEELNIGLLVVSHIKRMKDGEKVQKNSGRGSGSLEQLSDTMIAINKPKDQPDVSLYEVVKNRFSGEVGTACAVKYNIKTGRLTEMADTSGFEVEGDY
tara:strand:+ start:1436 stop:2974 length:1539 start_codon:yes stop_codon:yes gene_type:complete